MYATTHYASSAAELFRESRNDLVEEYGEEEEEEEDTMGSPRS